METGGFNLANHSEFLSIKRTNKLGTVRKAETGMSCHADVYVPEEIEWDQFKRIEWDQFKIEVSKTV